MTCVDRIDLTGLTASGFLDQHGDFAKDHAHVRSIALFFDDGNSPVGRVDLTVAEFDALPSEQQEQIRNAGSGARYL